MTPSANPITPEAQALLDADIAVAEAGLDDTAFMAAADARRIALAAYQATLAPKECRPPADAKDGDLFWLVNPTEKIVGEWVSNGWRLPGTTLHAREAGEDGWTVHSACTFPGERVEATEREVFYLAQYCGFAIPAIGGGTKYKFKSTTELLAYTQAALRHFSPALRPVSDEKIGMLKEGVAHVEFLLTQWEPDDVTGVMRFNEAEAWAKNVRAVQAFERGTG